MILDTIDNYEIYSDINAKIKKALEFLKKGDFELTKPGNYDLEDGVYYMVQEIQTRPEEGALYEAHLKYIDIQFVVSGNEVQGYAPLSSMKIKDAYDQEKDIAFYNGEGSLFRLVPGSFAIYFPNDAHKPNLCDDKPAPLKKIVIKIPV